MARLIKRGIGLLAFVAITIILAAGARGDDSSANKQAPVTAGQGSAAGTSAEPSHEALAKEMEVPGPCQPMPMGTMGAQRQGAGAMPGMGMMAMRRMPGMGMMMGMPGMDMMDMPMMQAQMMRMMARNPKLAGKMMQMHADMMRAMADVMSKYGKQMESGQWPALGGKADDGD
jgi:hypothetical protein